MWGCSHLHYPSYQLGKTQGGQQLAVHISPFWQHYLNYASWDQQETVEKCRQGSHDLAAPERSVRLWFIGDVDMIQGYRVINNQWGLTLSNCLLCIIKGEGGLHAVLVNSIIPLLVNSVHITPLWRPLHNLDRIPLSKIPQDTISMDTILLSSSHKLRFLVHFNTLAGDDKANSHPQNNEVVCGIDVMWTPESLLPSLVSRFSLANCFIIIRHFLTSVDIFLYLWHFMFTFPWKTFLWSFFY